MDEWFSFHGGHSGEFCRHARGTLREVLESAVERGFTTYGVSEHAPRDRAKDLLPGELDLTPADLHAGFDAYREAVRDLKREFEGRLEVVVGFEAEVVPPRDYIERMRSIRREGGFDYFVGSVHHVDDRFIDIDPALTAEIARDLGGEIGLDRAYFGAVAEMAAALRPPVVGHFDIIRRFRGEATGFATEVWPSIERALESVRAVEGVLEVNGSAARRRMGPPYPSVEILKRARAMGIGVTLGDDSHGPDDVGVGLDASIASIAAAGYTEIRLLGARAGAVPIERVRPRSRRG